MAGYIGSKASVVSSGAERKKVITATAGQTAFTGLTYSPNRVHVFQNGVRLVDGTDYTATDGTSLTLTVGASADDQVVVVSYSGFQTSDTVSSSAGGTFAGDVSFTANFTSRGIDDNATSTAMTLDGSGNLLVGKTATGLSNQGAEFSSTGQVKGTAPNQVVGYFNRTSSDGSIVEFRKDNSTVGSIGSLVGTRLTINSQSTAGYLGIGGTFYYAWNADDFRPMLDNSYDLGDAAARFDDIYATNGTIQTSDRNEKQDIDVLSDAEQRVAVACKGLLRKFRWKDAVAEKGDEARTHFGIIAQDLQAAFAAEGLDAGDYAMFISSTWTDEDTGEERTRMGVRYSELLAFIIGAL